MGSLSRATSDFMSLLYMGPLMLIRSFIFGALWDDDDEDDHIDETMNYYMRKNPAWGFLWGWSFDSILMMLYKNAQANDLAREKFMNVASPAGLPVISPYILNPMMDWGLKQDTKRGGWGRESRKRVYRRYFR